MKTTRVVTRSVSDLTNVYKRLRTVNTIAPINGVHVLGVFMLFSLSQLLAASVPVDRTILNAEQVLESVFVAGRTLTPSDLIQPTLTAFSGNSNNMSHITVENGGTVPPPGSRSQLLTHDFRLDTGIINPAVGDTAAAITFDPPIPFSLHCWG